MSTSSALEHNVPIMDYMMKINISKIRDLSKFYYIPDETMATGVDKLLEIIMNPMRVSPDNKEQVDLIRYLGLQKEPQYQEINNKISRIMEIGARNISQSLTTNPQLWGTIRKSLTFERQRSELNICNFLFDNETNRIIWPEKGRDIDYLYCRYTDCFMSTFSVIIYLMGEEALQLLSELMNTDARLTTIMLQIKYPGFLLRFIPFPIVRKISNKQLEMQITKAVERVQKLINSINTTTSKKLNEIEKTTLITTILTTVPVPKKPKPIVEKTEKFRYRYIDEEFEKLEIERSLEKELIKLAEVEAKLIKLKQVGQQNATPTVSRNTSAVSSNSNSSTHLGIGMVMLGIGVMCTIHLFSRSNKGNSNKSMLNGMWARPLAPTRSTIF